MAGADSVAVSGDHLVRNGAPFVVKGLILDAITAPTPRLRNPILLAGHRSFGQSILDAAKRWGANTIRFNLSEAGLDPKSSIYDQDGYLQEIRNDVAMARRSGFIVVVTDQDENPAGDPNPPRKRMPTDATLRADLTLAGMFKNDQGVIIDLYNEPSASATPDHWQLWLSGGTGSFFERGAGRFTEEVVGYQQLINTVRQSGARNVLFVGALDAGRTFRGAPLEISDPAGNFVYDVHVLRPSDGYSDEGAWQETFGFLADQGKPVVLGAADWAGVQQSWEKDLWCTADPSFALAQRFFDFLAKKRIGLIAWAFDRPGTIVADYNGTPTTFRGKHCGDVGTGAGELIRAQFGRT